MGKEKQKQKRRQAALSIRRRMNRMRTIHLSLMHGQLLQRHADEEIRSHTLYGVVSFVVDHGFHLQMNMVALTHTGRVWTAAALNNIGEA